MILRRANYITQRRKENVHNWRTMSKRYSLKRRVALTKAHRRKKLGLDHLFLSVVAGTGSSGGRLMRLIVSSFAVALLAVGVLTACNSAELKSAQNSPAAQAPTAPPASDGVRRVTVPELRDLLARNEAVVIDVRNQASFDAGHVRGAKLIPEAEIANHLDELPKNKLIVTYCS
jgi:Rhodanese-like domain